MDPAVKLARQVDRGTDRIGLHTPRLCADDLNKSITRGKQDGEHEGDRTSRVLWGWCSLLACRERRVRCLFRPRSQKRDLEHPSLLRYARVGSDKALVVWSTVRCASGLCG
jgi:hypothetical protein